MKKILIVIIVFVLIVASVGIYMLIRSSGEEGKSSGSGGRPSEILVEIKKATGIAFSPQTTVIWGWSTNEGSKTVFGSIFSANNIPSSKINAVSDFLESQNFHQDSLNTSGNYKGYEKVGLVCSVLESQQKIEVSCAELK